MEYVLRGLSDFTGDYTRGAIVCKFAESEGIEAREDLLRANISIMRGISIFWPLFRRQFICARLPPEIRLNSPNISPRSSNGSARYFARLKISLNLTKFQCFYSELILFYSDISSLAIR